LNGIEAAGFLDDVCIHWEEVIQALGSSCPELEHLKLTPWNIDSEIGLLTEAVLRLKRLVSLELTLGDWEGEEDGEKQERGG